MIQPIESGRKVRALISGRWHEGKVVGHERYKGRSRYLVEKPNGFKYFVPAGDVFTIEEPGRMILAYAYGDMVAWRIDSIEEAVEFMLEAHRAGEECELSEIINGVEVEVCSLEIAKIIKEYHTEENEHNDPEHWRDNRYIEND